MALVFKTAKDAPQTVEISGVGVLGAEGKGGRPVSEAALVMAELQKRDDQGRLVLDEDENPVPLSGKALEAAAKKYADANGLEVVNVAEDKLAALAEESGAAPTRDQTAAEAAAKAYQDIYAGLVPENTPEQMTGEEQSPQAAQPSDAEAGKKEEEK